MPPGRPAATRPSAVLSIVTPHDLEDVRVVHADATPLPFEQGHYDSAVALTILHHVSSEDLQDCLFGEVRRVLVAGCSVGLVVGWRAIRFRGNPLTEGSH
jgi:hypothetical protein